jgi:hypothetical protein
MSPASSPHPDSFFEVRVHDLARKPGLTAVCASYELKEWRHKQLAGHLIKWLPEFALTYSDPSRLGLESGTDGTFSALAYRLNTT